MKSDLSIGNVTDTMLKQLPFIKGKLRYVSIDKKNKPVPHTWLYTVDDDSVEKINALLKGGALVPLPAKSKGYVIPGCKYSVAQLRDIARMNNWTITNDASKADFFIGHEHNVSSGNTNGGVPENLIVKQSSVYCYSISSEFDRQKLKAKSASFNFLDDAESLVIFSRGYYHRYDSWSPLYGTEQAFNFLHPRTVEMLHRILSMNTPVIDEDQIFNSIERVTIDENMYNTLCSMFNSDMDSRSVAAEMLYNCNYETSLYYIYKLIKADYYTVRSSMSNSNFSLFESKLKLQDLRSTDFPDAIGYFYKKNLLTEEIYDNLLLDIVETSNVEKLSDKVLKYVKLVPAWVKTYDEYIQENKPKEEPKPEAPLPF